MGNARIWAIYFTDEVVKNEAASRVQVSDNFFGQERTLNLGIQNPEFLKCKTNYLNCFNSAIQWQTML